MRISLTVRAATRSTQFKTTEALCDWWSAYADYVANLAKTVEARREIIVKIRQDLQAENRPEYRTVEKKAVQLKEKKKDNSEESPKRPNALSKGPEPDYPFKHFGITLPEAAAEDAEPLPRFVIPAFEYLHTTSRKLEGAFRLSGSTSAIQALKAKVENGEVPDFSEVLDAHNVTGLIKLFLRELTDPLLTAALAERWLQLQIYQDELKPPHMRTLVAELPEANRLFLRQLTEFADWLMVNEETTKMSPANLAIVLGPTILNKSGAGMEALTVSMAQSLAGANTVVAVLIRSHSAVFLPAMSAERKAQLEAGQIEVSPDLQNEVWVEDGKTTLHYAAEHGLQDATRHLLGCVHCPDLRDVFNNTPLHYACAKGQEAVASLLVSYGANPGYKNLQVPNSHASLPPPGTMPNLRGKLVSLWFRPSRTPLPSQTSSRLARAQPTTFAVLRQKDHPARRLLLKVTALLTSGGPPKAAAGKKATPKVSPKLPPREDSGPKLPREDSGPKVAREDSAPRLAREDSPSPKMPPRTKPEEAPKLPPRSARFPTH